jgi:DNA-binding NarL/FixJ family response regulator
MIGSNSVIVTVMTGSDLTQIAAQVTLNKNVTNEIKICCNQSVSTTVQLPHVLILDDYTVAQRSEKQLSHARCILLSNRHEPFYIQQTIEQGFSGYLYLGDSLAERLPQAVRDVAAGGRYLSPTAAAALASLNHYAQNIQPRITTYQLEVLRLMSQHWSSGRIAVHLGRTTTAIYQVQRFLRDLFEVETNGELLDRVAELGILPDTRRVSA